MQHNENMSMNLPADYQPSFSERRRLLGLEMNGQTEEASIARVIKKFQILIEDILVALTAAAQAKEDDIFMCLKTQLISDPWVNTYAPESRARMQEIIGGPCSNESQQRNTIPVVSPVLQQPLHNGRRPRDVIRLRPPTPITASLARSVRTSALRASPGGSVTDEELLEILLADPDPLRALRAAVEQQRVGAQFAASVARELWYCNAARLNDVQAFCARVLSVQHDS